MATLIPAVGASRVLTPQNGVAFELADLQCIVEGFIEVLALADGRLMVLNERGKLLRLPLNAQATALVRDRLQPGDVIVGDVLVCTRAELEEPEQRTVPA